LYSLGNKTAVIHEEIWRLLSRAFFVCNVYNYIAQSVCNNNEDYNRYSAKTATTATRLAQGPPYN